MAINIPIFLSCPSVLSDAQNNVYDFVCSTLASEGMLPRALGRSDFPHSDPMTEVFYIARACYGGVILGFSQMQFEQGIFRKNTLSETPLDVTSLASSWNQIEAGMLVALQRPLLIFVEKGVTGGVFDRDSVAGCVQELDPEAITDVDREQIVERVKHWGAAVRTAFRS